MGVDLRRSLIAAVLVPCLVAALARASMITVSFDPQGTVCEAPATCHTTGRLQIVALLYGDAATAGIAGAEFRMDGFPSEWFTIITPNPAAPATCGNPLAGICFLACDLDPLLTLCDAPYFSKIMVSGGQAAFNDPGFCAIGVAPAHLVAGEVVVRVNAA